MDGTYTSTGALCKIVDITITDDDSLNADSTVSRSVTLPTVSGYTPVGVVGINILSATHNGANWGQICIGRNLCADSRTNLSVSFRNTGSSSTAVFKAIGQVLYIKS